MNGGFDRISATGVEPAQRVNRGSTFRVAVIARVRVCGLRKSGLQTLEAELHGELELVRVRMHGHW